MRRVIVIAVVGGKPGRLLLVFSAIRFKPRRRRCRSSSNSIPPGADATTSLGPGCKTPCSVAVPAADAGFAVTFAMPRFLPATVPVQVINNPGDFGSPASITIDPNPVFAELRPAGPPPKPVRSQAAEEAEAAQGRAAPPAAAGSPFPNPAPPPPRRPLSPLSRASGATAGSCPIVSARGNVPRLC